MNDPILTTLGLARRAGLLACGTQAVTQALRQRMAFMVLIGSDISQKSEKELRYFAGEEVGVYRLPYVSEQIGRALGLRVGIVSVNDEGFARAIRKKLD